MKLTDAQRKALELAIRNDGTIYAGHNVNNGCRRTIGANTIKSLDKLGLVTLGKTTSNETWARITVAGVEAIWSGMCPSNKHGLDYPGQACDLCRVQKHSDDDEGCP